MFDARSLQRDGQQRDGQQRDGQRLHLYLAAY